MDLLVLCDLGRSHKSLRVCLGSCQGRLWWLGQASPVVKTVGQTHQWRRAESQPNLREISAARCGSGEAQMARLGPPVCTLIEAREQIREQMSWQLPFLLCRPEGRAEWTGKWSLDKDGQEAVPLPYPITMNAQKSHYFSLSPSLSLYPEFIWVEKQWQVIWEIKKFLF